MGLAVALLQPPFRWAGAARLRGARTWRHGPARAAAPEPCQPADLAACSSCRPRPGRPHRAVYGQREVPGLYDYGARGTVTKSDREFTDARRARSSLTGCQLPFPGITLRAAPPADGSVLRCCGRRVSRIRHLRGGRTIATITVAAPTMLPRSKRFPATSKCGTAERDAAEVARGAPVAARTIEEGASAPNDGRPFSPDEQLQVLDGFVGGYYIRCTRSGAHPSPFLDPGGAGDATSLRSSRVGPHGRKVADGRSHAAREQPDHAQARRGSACGFRTCISTTTRTTWRCANTPTPRAGRSTTPRCDAHVPGPRHIPLVTTSIPLACARAGGRASERVRPRAGCADLFVSDGSVMNTEAAANAALTVVAPRRPHRGAADGERSSRTGPAGWFARADE